MTATAPPKRLRRLTCGVLLTSVVCCGSGFPQAVGERLDVARSISIDAVALDEALRSLARQADLQILFAPGLVMGREVRPVTAAPTPRRALLALLEGTGLEADERAPGVIVIRRAPASTAPVAGPAAHRPAVAAVPVEAIDEITVSAERRLERVQDVPVSVTVYTSAALDEQSIRSVDDLARLTPGLTFVHGTNYNSESSRIAIRGVDSIAGAATTGVYIDDTPIQSRHLSFGTFNAYPALFDLDRVEVLRGPQGTLFGSGSEGGTLRFITVQPTLDGAAVYGRAEAAGETGGGPVAEAGVAVGALLAPDLAARVGADYRYEGGDVARIDWHARRLLDADSNAATTEVARLALQWQPLLGLAVTPSVYYQTRHVDDSSAWWALVPGAFDPTGGQFNAPFRNGNALANPSTDSFVLTALKAEWAFSRMRLVSNTSYYDRRESAVTDYTEYDRAVVLGNPFPAAGVAAPTTWADDQRNLVQEMRLESATGTTLRWTTGVFYQHAFESTAEDVFDPALVAQRGFPVYRGGYLYYQEPFDSLDRQLAAYGQADVRVAEAWTATAGLRYTGALFSGHANFAGPVVGTPVASAGTLLEHPVTPKAAVTYQLAPDSLVYAAVAKGYRVGGVNPAVGQFCYGGPGTPLGSIGLGQVPGKYDSDSVVSYEVGGKGYSENQRALLNWSGYVIHWGDIQQNVPLLGCGFQFTANLGRAEITGFDLQGQIRVTDALALGGTLSFTDARYTETVRLGRAAASVVKNGDRIAGSPWALTVFAESDFTLLERSGYLRLESEYQARQSAAVANQDPRNATYQKWFPSVPTQTDTTLRAGVRWQNVDVSAFVENLLDTHPRLTVNQDVGTPDGGTPLLYVITTRPRTVGLTVVYRR